MTDPSPTLNENPCIEVSINRECNESADSFQAQLQYRMGMCEGGDSEAVQAPTQSINNCSLSEGYTTCIPIHETGAICYTAQVYHNGTSVVVGRTEPQQLLLLPCNTSSLGFEGATINMGEVTPGDEVAHNVMLKLQCDAGYNLARGSNLTFRCVNETIQPEPRTDTTFCTLTRPPGTCMCYYCNTKTCIQLYMRITLNITLLIIIIE